MSLIMSKQRAARLLNVLHVAFLLVVQRIDRVQDFAEAQNAVKRRSQFVAHGGEEIALEHVQFVEPHVHLGQLVDLAVQVGVDLPQFFLDGGQVAQHAVEGHGQFLEFVAGMDIGPLRDVAAADRVAHVAQMAQRLDDDVAHDQVRGDHRQHHGDDGGGQQHGPIQVQLCFHGAVGNLYFGDGQQIAFVFGGHPAQGHPRACHVDS